MSKNAPRFLDYRRSPLPLDVALSFAVATQTSSSTTSIICVRNVVGRELVLSGRVRVNGIVETSRHRLVRRKHDRIEVLMCGDEVVDGSSWMDVVVAMPRYYACYKPRGVVCSAGRNEGIDRADSVLISDWLKGGLENIQECARMMKTVGRLDEESEGLLLLTDDGSFSRLLCDPEFGLEKTYRVVMRGSGDCGDTTTTPRLAEIVADMIHRGQSTRPHFTYESCRVLDAGRLPTQHPSDDSYYALADLVLREGKRHAVRRIIKNASVRGGRGGTLRVCYLSRIGVEGLACGVVKPESLIEAQAMGFLPVDGERHRKEVPAGKLVLGDDDDYRSMLLHPGHLVELSGCDVDTIFALRSLGYR
jgi:pseudouridine synthase